MRQMLLLFHKKKIGAGEANHDQYQRDFDAALDGTFQGPEIFSYALDKLVWHAVHGGIRYLDVVYNGGVLATIVSHAVVRGALRRPAPQFPPWDSSNHHKYLVDEPIIPDDPVEANPSEPIETGPVEPVEANVVEGMSVDS